MYFFNEISNLVSDKMKAKFINYMGAHKITKHVNTCDGDCYMTFVYILYVITSFETTKTDFCFVRLKIEQP